MSEVPFFYNCFARWYLILIGLVNLLLPPILVILSLKVDLVQLSKFLAFALICGIVGALLKILLSSIYISAKQASPRK